MSVHFAERTGKTLDAGLLKRWEKVPVAVAVDMDPGVAIDPAIRPLRPAGLQPRLFGRALVARVTPPDFGAVLHAVAMIEPGDVLVIDAGGETSHAMIGGILGEHIHRIGAAGIVCDGAVRDVAELAALDDFSVFSRSINPLGPTGATTGEVGEPVTIGGRRIASGDLILGDDDGLAALSPDDMARLIGKAEGKLALEEDWLERLRNGDAIPSVFDL